jgi:indolepyruvate ferredoxin oxidoreductase beta subunit
VDLVIASELMEAGRSILRGLATPDRTTLITSTHRSYAVSEKEKPGEAIGDPRVVNAATKIATKRIISFDMEAVAKASGTVISAPIFGAVAGCNVLPFSRQSFEAVISGGGRGVSASLKGFAEGYARANQNELPQARITSEPTSSPLPIALRDPRLNAGLTRIRNMPADVQAMAFTGWKRTVDYQDIRYGEEYLDKVTNLLVLDQQHGGVSHNYAFGMAAAKHVARAMTYDDVISVADLKTRSSRFDRIAADMKSGSDPIYLTEFMHPSAVELSGLLPRRLGQRVTNNPTAMRMLNQLFNRGRYIQTAKLRGFLQLYAVAALRHFRRGNLRHAEEMTHMETWLKLVCHHLPSNYALATGILNTRRLVKGYSDTHARGLSKYDLVLSAVPALATREDAGEWMNRLISAALKDEDGKFLDGALATIQSF